MKYTMFSHYYVNPDICNTSHYGLYTLEIVYLSVNNENSILQNYRQCNYMIVFSCIQCWNIFTIPCYSRCHGMVYNITATVYVYIDGFCQCFCMMKTANNEKQNLLSHILCCTHTYTWGMSVCYVFV